MAPFARRTEGSEDVERQSPDSKELPPEALEAKPYIRQLANPAPLGLCAFALTTFVLSLINVQARHVATPNIVIGIGKSKSLRI